LSLFFVICLEIGYWKLEILHETLSLLLLDPDQLPI